MRQAVENTICSEPFRPHYHFTPERFWMNDPNGLVYFEDEYHLFYQHHPYSTQWGPMHWGHAVSRDLVHWDHLPVALAPDEHGYIFSGCAVVDWGDTSGFFGGKPGLVAIFTHCDEYPNSKRSRQRQSIAYSNDRGRTWTKYEGNPVLVEPDLTDFRDPKVFWHNPSQSWIMIISAGDRVRFYGSKNLLEWTYLSEFGESDGAHGGVWECPDLFPLEIEGEAGRMKWVLTVADAGDVSGIVNTQYFVGEFDGVRFCNDNKPDLVLWSDWGSDFYAAQSWSDIKPEDGRRLWIAWMSNFGYIRQTPTESWRGTMSIPRCLKLKRLPDEGLRLVQMPLKELEKLRTGKFHLTHTDIVPGRNELSGIQTNVAEIVAAFEVGTSSGFGFKLAVGDTEELVVGYDVKNSQFYVDRTRSSMMTFDTSGRFASKYVRSVKEQNGRVDVRIFIDKSTLEVFVNGGEAVFSHLIFPDPASTGMELFTLDGATKLISLDLFELQSAAFSPADIDQ
ncbi:glycoside hydrolase family 32 protein [Paenibacillaceae bacterium WGS1546]|uniref:glycoside hydrolase family 32 protein n=1 Tax=Cohnella sp. WGS1546 TaxID=3366810 RepID=UPI00372D0F97